MMQKQQRQTPAATNYLESHHDMRIKIIKREDTHHDYECTLLLSVIVLSFQQQTNGEGWVVLLIFMNCMEQKQTNIPLVCGRRARKRKEERRKKAA
jgi:hypothetical protein